MTGTIRVQQTVALPATGDFQVSVLVGVLAGVFGAMLVAGGGLVTFRRIRS